MYLILDIGNTRSKWAVYSPEGMLCASDFFQNDNLDIFITLKKEWNITHSMLAASGKAPAELVYFLETNTHFFKPKPTEKLPFRNLYESPETLGHDRLAIAVCAFYQYPKQNCLCLSAGTCITYDLLTASGDYLGGGISPGIDMRLRAMAHFTDKLPKIEVDFEENIFIGKNTTQALRFGAQEAALMEIEGAIARYSSVYLNLNVLITGGDRLFFENRLKSKIFATENFVFYGLYKLLCFYVK